MCAVPTISVKENVLGQLTPLARMARHRNHHILVCSYDYSRSWLIPQAATLPRRCRHVTFFSGTIVRSYRQDLDFFFYVAFLVSYFLHNKRAIHLGQSSIVFKNIYVRVGVMSSIASLVSRPRHPAWPMSSVVPTATMPSSP